MEAPTSWDDLLKPEFTGQVMVAHPSTSGTSYTALATVLQIRGEEAGWEYLKAYAAQMAQFTKSGAAPAKFVGAGEAAVAIVFSHDAVNEIDNNGLPLVITFPEGRYRLRDRCHGHPQGCQASPGSPAYGSIGRCQPKASHWDPSIMPTRLPRSLVSPCPIPN